MSRYYERKPGWVRQEAAALKRRLSDWAFMRRYCRHRGRRSAACLGVAYKDWLKAPRPRAHDAAHERMLADILRELAGEPVGAG